MQEHQFTTPTLNDAPTSPVVVPAYGVSEIRRGSETSEHHLTWAVTLGAMALLLLQVTGAITLPDEAGGALCLVLGVPVSVYTAGRSLIKKGRVDATPVAPADWPDAVDPRRVGQ